MLDRLALPREPDVVHPHCESLDVDDRVVHLVLHVVASCSWIVARLVVARQFADYRTGANSPRNTASVSRPAPRIVARWRGATPSQSAYPRTTRTSPRSSSS